MTRTIASRFAHPAGLLLLVLLAACGGSEPPTPPPAEIVGVQVTPSTARLEFLPVLEDGRAVGLVPVTALFRATAALALTPEDQGIRFDQ